MRLVRGVAGVIEGKYSMELWTDKELKNIKDLFEEVNREGKFQIEKWGIQSHTIFEWLCFLGEEVGELNEAAAEYYYRGESILRIREEAIQVATLALKIAEMTDDDDWYKKEVGILQAMLAEILGDGKDDDGNWLYSIEYNYYTDYINA